MHKIILSKQQRTAIEQHTLAEYPYEMCGFLTETDFIPCNNIAERKENPFETGFRFDPKDTVKWVNQAIAIVHSHCRPLKQRELTDLRTPSYLDIVNQKQTNFPWLIVGCEGESVSAPLQFPRIPSNDYLNRPFIWTVNDCYTIVQDWYRFELGIILKDAVVTENFEDIRYMNNLFEEHISSFGFKEVPFKEIRKGDLLMLDNHHCASNHLAVYTGTSVIHQDTLTVKVPLESFLGRIRQVLRYE